MKEKDKLQLKTGDYCIILVVFIAIVVLFLGMSSLKPGNTVRVTVHKHTTIYNLHENQRIPLMSGAEYEDSRQIANTLVIENGQVYMESADCPDQVCVKHKPVSKDGEMIVCLPNEVFVEIESDVENEIDN